ncbi:DNA double-strand break repair protein Mre11 [Haloplanus halobius]|uniref:DNA double-strand break repair protein Mre11 n=1 Tax=Haloplanus halobius TaxID=2934938 RepID=UPI00200DFD90|nr:DNA double-strand break repair protein Mre11 [Haloplanus sp. XH21]
MTRVIHTGDTHVGYRQYHSPERRQDFLDAFEAVVDDAVDDASDGVDAVVHAGDLFHDRRPDLPDLLGVLSALRRLDAAGVPFLAIVGNHEATRGSQWLDLFSDLGLATRLADEPTVVGETAFYGLDHVPPSRRDELDYEFVPHDANHAVLVAHGLFTPFPHADWDTETVLDAANVDFDALLLGDNHVADRAQVDDTWVTYCGSTERASAEERDARGYNLVEFGADAGGETAVDVRRRSLDTRPFVFVDVDLAADEGVDRVREQVRQHDLDDAVAVVTITGGGEPVTPAAVEEAAVEEGALLARVTDHRAVGGDPTDAAPDVEFGDPDAAVRERVREMDLSDSGRHLDETVRDDGLADSNVRDRVADFVADAVADGDLDDVETDETDDAAGDDGADDPDDQVSMEDFL